MGESQVNWPRFLVPIFATESIKSLAGLWLNAFRKNLLVFNDTSKKIVVLVDV